MTVNNDPVKYMSIKEFRSEGYLQEVNRRFFHPLGLALEIRQQEDGEWVLGGIWDFRDDPEGMNYADGVINHARADNIEALLRQRQSARFNALGYIIQPVPEAEQS